MFSQDDMSFFLWNGLYDGDGKRKISRDEGLLMVGHGDEYEEFLPACLSDINIDLTRSYICKQMGFDIVVNGTTVNQKPWLWFAKSFDKIMAHDLYFGETKIREISSDSCSWMNYEVLTCECEIKTAFGCTATCPVGYLDEKTGNCESENFKF